MLKLNAQEIRDKWINFFTKNDHQYIENLSLIPENDHSLLFVNSGVAAIKEYFVGNKKASKPRLVNCQKVIRTVDIENIGKTTRHHTFFEMLGNFSIGDYFKERAIKLGYTFLVDELGIDKNSLYFTIFKEDSESYQIYKDLGIEDSHLVKCDKDRNFWDMGCGPCGPCTEIYIDRGQAYDPKNMGLDLLINDEENERYLEIWNIVFSEFFNKNGVIVPASTKNIDTGMGLERLLTILENKSNNFENSLFRPIIEAFEAQSPFKYFKKSGITEQQRSYYEIMVDHYRACVMILAEDIDFSNKDKGYVLRKLFRRSLLAATYLNVKEGFIAPITNKVIETLAPYHKQLKDKATQIIAKLEKEYTAFVLILQKSQSYIDALVKSASEDPTSEIEKGIFTLVERHGIPYDLIKEMLAEKNISFSHEKYEAFFNEHRNVSKNKNFKPAFNHTGDVVKARKPQATDFVYNKDKLESLEILCIYDESLKLCNSLDKQTGYLLFKETIFFPDSAGQEKDEGYIDQCEVTDVIKNQDLEILHKVEQGTFSVGQKVSMTIDSVKRKHVSQHHTCEHVTYGLLQRVISSDIYRVSAKKNKDHFTLLVFSNDELTRKHLSILESCIDKLIKDQQEIKSWNCDYKTAKELKLNPDKLLDKNSAINVFRVVHMGEVSLELCIGTHLNNCSELEQAILTNISKKGDKLYELTGVVGSDNIKHFLDTERDEFVAYTDQIFKQINTLLAEIFAQIGKSFQVLETKLNHFKQLANEISKTYYEEPFLKAKAKEVEFCEELTTWKKEITNNINNILFTKLTKLFDESLSEKISNMWVENYKQKEMFNFIKGYKLPDKVNTLLVFNKQDEKDQFYILGNAEHSAKILSHLKENYSGVGGGAGIISGSIKIGAGQKEEVKKAIDTFIKQLNG